MENRAAELGRKFIFCDLNDQGQGGWHPLIGGSERVKRARILMAFGLENTGNESDFYKINERQVSDEIMPRTTKVKGLVQTMEQQGLDGNAKRMYGGF